MAAVLVPDTLITSVVLSIILSLVLYFVSRMQR